LDYAHDILHNASVRIPNNGGWTKGTVELAEFNRRQRISPCKFKMQLFLYARKIAKDCFITESKLKEAEISNSNLYPIMLINNNKHHALDMTLLQECLTNLTVDVHS
jgi:hypothetical protein